MYCALVVYSILIESKEIDCEEVKVYGVLAENPCVIKVRDDFLTNNAQ